MLDFVKTQIPQMLHLAQNAIQNHSSADQILVAMTKNGQFHTYAMHVFTSCKHSDEKAFLSAYIPGCTENPLTAVLCMWNNGQIDMISGYLREEIQKATDTPVYIALQGAEDIHLRDIHTL